VAVDRFIKWIEAKPVTSADAKAAVNFIHGIVFWFGVPNSIVTDNGSNFTSREFKDYCEGLGIKLQFTSHIRKPMARWKKTVSSTTASRSIIGATRKSKACLGRRVALFVMELANNTQYNNSRDSSISGSWYRSCTSGGNIT
jgi:transposase InsO family protein